MKSKHRKKTSTPATNNLRKAINVQTGMTSQPLVSQKASTTQSGESSHAPRQEKIVKLKEAVALTQEYTNEIISELNVMNEEVTITRDYADAIIRTVRGPLLVLNKDLRIISANEAFYNAFKVAPSDTENRLLYDLGNRQWNIPKLRVLLEEILPEKNTIEDFVVEHDFRDIGQKTMLLNARTLRQGPDKTSLILLAIEDITRQEEIDLAKDEFVSIASHQLRTPATGVKQALGLLVGGYIGKLTKKQLEMVEVALSSNERELRLIDDLLNIATVDSGKMVIHKQTTDLGKLIRTTAANLQPTLHTRHQHITLGIPANPISASVDPDRLMMVLDNLSSNASKYTPDGGKISLSLESSPAKISIIVKDNGIGIPDDQHDKLFKKFTRIDSQLSRARNGSGVGLYLCERIVSLHGGKIVVKSAANKGSEFIIQLPKKGDA